MNLLESLKDFKTLPEGLQQQLTAGHARIDTMHSENVNEHGPVAAQFIKELAVYLSGYRVILDIVVNSEDELTKVVGKHVLANIMASLTNDLAKLHFGKDFDSKLVFFYIGLAKKMNEEVHKVNSTDSFQQFMDAVLKN